MHWNLVFAAFAKCTRLVNRESDYLQNKKTQNKLCCLISCTVLSVRSPLVFWRPSGDPLRNPMQSSGWWSGPSKRPSGFCCLSLAVFEESFWFKNQQKSFESRKSFFCFLNCTSRFARPPSDDSERPACPSSTSHSKERDISEQSMFTNSNFNISNCQIEF